MIVTDFLTLGFSYLHAVLRTAQDSLKAEESMKQELQMRLAVAKFMQETLQEMAEKKSSSAGGDKDASGAKEVRTVAQISEVLFFV